MARKKLVLPATPSILRTIKSKFTRDRKVHPLGPSDYIRSSSLPNICAREEVLASALNIIRDDPVDSDLNLTFAQGTGMHWVMQNKVLPAIGEFLVGQWRCTSCGKLIGDATAAETRVPWPGTCPHCQTIFEIEDGGLEYVELDLANTEYRLTGHNDGFLRIPGADGEGVFELKSASSFRAKAVRDVPDMGHVAQVQAYMWLTHTRWSILLYWDKGTFRGPLIEHFVERDEDAIGEIKSMLSSIWTGIETGELPKRICSSPDCNRAEECPLAETCFEHESKVEA
jgi:phage FluMu protein Com